MCNHMYSAVYIIYVRIHNLIKLIINTPVLVNRCARASKVCVCVCCDLEVWIVFASEVKLTSGVLCDRVTGVHVYMCNTISTG